jgi:GDP/UDP-N,N'-diacetylbacillosamine 2-epimerase (hydrolysing)
MKIGVLTSSRADYSIYYPLLKAIQSDSFFSLKIIAFGTHLSSQHGLTLNRIIDDNFDVEYSLETAPINDTPNAISASIGKTITMFSEIWQSNKYDLVLCLGDRYEMFAACASAIPFGLQLAHIHGGEQTLGAIDEVFRHSITSMSSYHFTACEAYKSRVIQLKGSEKNVFNVGSLSIDNLKDLKLYSIEEFKDRFDIDLSIPSILITFHSETVSYEKNEFYISELISALESTKGYQFIITMPNTDTMSQIIRAKLHTFIGRANNAFGVESFGTIGYLSCMKHCHFLLGNTSSGYIEASFFPKYVIDIGNRQLGRIVTQNIQRCNIDKNEIIMAIKKYNRFLNLPKIEIYGKGNAAQKIIEILKTTNG